MLKLLRADRFDDTLDAARRLELEPLVRRVVEDLQPFLEARHQEVELRIEPGLGDGRGRSGQGRRHPDEPAGQRDQVHPRRRHDPGHGRSGRARPGPLPDRGHGRRHRSRRSAGTCSSRSSPATTRCITPRASSSSASGGWAWGSAWSRRSSSCTAARSRSRPSRRTGRPSASSYRDGRSHHRPAAEQLAAGMGL